KKVLEIACEDCRGCAFSADGKLIATHSSNGGVHIWDAATGKLVKQLKANGKFAAAPNTFVAFSSDGTFLVSGGQAAETAEVWNLKTGKVVCTISGKAFFRSAFFAPGNSQSVVCVEAGMDTAFLYHLVAEKVVHRFNPPARLAHFAGFSPDG